MFNKSNNTASTPAKTPSSPIRGGTQNAAPTILARDIAIIGDVTTEGDIQIDGRLDGNVEAGTVTIGEQGEINGRVTAGNVLIRGKITGHVEANTIELSETANVQADLVQEQLTIANGAFFDGKCTRFDNKPAAIIKPNNEPVQSVGASIVSLGSAE